MKPDFDSDLTDEEIEAARRRIADIAVRTPLVRIGERDSWLKLECLQPVGSYKIRGATNVLKARLESGEELRSIVAASAGNFGQALAAAARRLGLPIVIHVPETAARVKVENLLRMGATVREHPFDIWWEIMRTRRTEDGGTFFHPVCEREVIAGAATIGEEISEDLPGIDEIWIPIGGGGLAAGIAQALKRRRTGCRIVAVETEAATPLKAALEAGEPVSVGRETSFIDGMGSTRVLDEMWPLLRRLVDDVVVVTIREVEAAIRKLAADHHVIAEGAGAAAVAAMTKSGASAAVAIVSGGNLDWTELRRILT